MVMGKRLEYIDLAKGVGIFFIVALHIGALPVWLPKLSAAWVPLFFILSGMFFKPEERMGQMIIKKINTILIPFLFFYIASYLIFYLVNGLVPGLLRTDAKGIQDLLYQEGYFNGPIWFLLSLFWDFIILWGIFKVFSTTIIRILVVAVIGVIGIVLGLNHVFVPLKIAQSFTALPFMYIGYEVRKQGLMKKVKRKASLIVSVLLFLVSVCLAYWFGPCHLEPSTNNFVGNISFTLLIILSFSFATIFICKAIAYIPLLNYFGRYSLIPLCTHHLIYRPIMLISSKLPPPIL